MTRPKQKPCPEDHAVIKGNLRIIKRDKRGDRYTYPIGDKFCPECGAPLKGEK